MDNDTFNSRDNIVENYFIGKKRIISNFFSLNMVTHREELGKIFIFFTSIILIGIDLFNKGLFYKIDIVINNLKWLKVDKDMRARLMLLDNLGLRSLTTITLLILTLIIARKIRDYKIFRLVIFNILLLNLLVGSLKLAFGRCKPREFIESCMLSGGMSYPSGHVANAVATWSLVAYFVTLYVSSSKRVENLTKGVYISVVLLVSITSLLRNTHWVTDIISGALAGLITFKLTKIFGKIFVNQYKRI